MGLFVQIYSVKFSVLNNFVQCGCVRIKQCTLLIVMWYGDRLS